MSFPVMAMGSTRATRIKLMPAGRERQRSVPEIDSTRNEAAWSLTIEVSLIRVTGFKKLA